MKKKVLGSAIVGTVLVGGLALVGMSVQVIPQGHVGVVFSPASGVREQVLNEGWTLVNPIDRVTAYPVSTETIDVPYFNVLTRDGKELRLSLSYDYSNDAERVAEIFTKFRGQSPSAIEGGWLEDRAQRAALTIFSRYSVLDVFQNLARIQHDIFEEFRGLVAEYGFNVSAVTLRAPELDDNTRAMIQQVVDSQMELERMEFEREQAILFAETQREQARGIADALLIEAEAEAQANELLQQSLTDAIIASQWIEAWDGRLPQVSSDGSFLMDISTLLDSY